MRRTAPAVVLLYLALAGVTEAKPVPTPAARGAAEAYAKWSAATMGASHSTVDRCQRRTGQVRCRVTITGQMFFEPVMAERVVTFATVRRAGRWLKVTDSLLYGYCLVRPHRVRCHA